MTKSEATNNIVKFVLNIATWQINNRGFYHEMAVHLQDLIDDFIIEWIVVDNGDLRFKGLRKITTKYINDEISAKDLNFEQLVSVLNILKNIDMFGSSGSRYISVEISKKNVKAFQTMCEYAEAYMDLHSIKKPSVSNAIYEIKDIARMLGKGKPSRDGKV